MGTLVLIACVAPTRALSALRRCSSAATTSGSSSAAGSTGTAQASARVVSSSLRVLYKAVHPDLYQQKHPDVSAANASALAAVHEYLEDPMQEQRQQQYRPQLITFHVHKRLQHRETGRRSPEDEALLVCRVPPPPRHQQHDDTRRPNLHWLRAALEACGVQPPAALISATRQRRDRGADVRPASPSSASWAEEDGGNAVRAALLRHARARKGGERSREASLRRAELRAATAGLQAAMRTRLGVRVSFRAGVTDRDGPTRTLRFAESLARAVDATAVVCDLRGLSIVVGDMEGVDADGSVCIRFGDVDSIGRALGASNRELARQRSERRAQVDAMACRAAAVMKVAAVLPIAFCDVTDHEKTRDRQCVTRRAFSEFLERVMERGDWGGDEGGGRAEDDAPAAPLSIVVTGSGCCESRDFSSSRHVDKSASFGSASRKGIHERVHDDGSAVYVIVRADTTIDDLGSYLCSRHYTETVMPNAFERKRASEARAHEYEATIRECRRVLNLRKILRDPRVSRSQCMEFCSNLLRHAASIRSLCDGVSIRLVPSAEWDPMQAKDGVGGAGAGGTYRSTEEDDDCVRIRWDQPIV